MVKHKLLVQEQCRPDIINVLVGNKSDIKLKKLEKKHGRDLAYKTGFIKYIEISAKEGVNIGKVMETVLSEVEKNMLWQPERTERRQTISLMSTRYGGSTQAGSLFNGSAGGFKLSSELSMGGKSNKQRMKEQKS